MKDNRRAQIVGSTTLGTGTVLSTYQLKDGSALLLGTQQWLTPSGQTIKDHGITPDEVVSLPEGATTLQPGELLTRNPIRSKLWPNGTIVEFDHSINTAIKKLRRALDDSADGPQYIETIARRGYRLMVPVEWITSNIEVPGNGSENSADPGLPLTVPPEPAGDESLVEKLRLSSLTGKVVSHYRVLDIIGGGGGGLVYRRAFQFSGLVRNGEEQSHPLGGGAR